MMIHKKVILAYSDLAKITLLVRLVRPQDCAWCPLGETFLAHLLDHPGYFEVNWLAFY